MAWPQPIPNMAGVTQDASGYTVTYDDAIFKLVNLETPAGLSVLTQFLTIGSQYSIPPPSTNVYGVGEYTLLLYMKPGQDIPLAYAVIVKSIVNNQMVHEVYNVSRHTNEYAKGAGITIAKFITTRYLTIGDNPNNNPIIWLGVRVEGGVMNLIRKVYGPAGFYFPSVADIPTMPIETIVPDEVTPRGFNPGFRFYSGYTSPLIQQFLESQFAMSVKLTIPDGLVREMTGNPESIPERYGWLDHTHEISGALIGIPGGQLVEPEQGSGRISNPGNTAQDRCYVQVFNTGSLIGKGNHVVVYHTHPFECHRQIGLISGFPSTADYQAYIHHSSTEDASAVFAREGVFMYQYHPFYKFLIMHGYAPQPNDRDLEVFIQRSNEIQKIRTGINENVSALAAAYARGEALSPEQIAYVYAHDPSAVFYVVQKMSSILIEGVPNLAVKFPFLLIQFSPRGRPADFYFPAQVVSSFRRGGHRRKAHRRTTYRRRQARRTLKNIT